MDKISNSKISLYGTKTSLALVICLFCSMATAKNSNKILLTGSSTVAPLVAELARSYEEKNKYVRIEVQTGGSSKGVIDCREQLNDAGMISRSLKQDETDIKATPIARDGLAFIVNKKNKVNNLSHDQVVKIYTGQITNWRELGGENRKIIVMNKAEGRATLELFQHHFQLKSSQIKAAIVIGDEEQGIKTVANTPDAIGYLSVSTAESAINHQAKIHTVNLDGKRPTMAAVRSGNYKLSRYLNLIHCGDLKPEVKGFVQYITSPEGQKAIENLKYIPL